MEDILDQNWMMQIFFTFWPNTYTFTSLIIIIIYIFGEAYSLAIQLYLLHSNEMLHKYNI